MVEMRDNLINTILQIYKDDTLPCVMYFTEEEAEFIADKLIESGVILPPYKVGDTVWFIKDENSYFSEPKSAKIQTILIAEYDIVFKTKNRAFNTAVIGETVFLTREEAERVLKTKLDEKQMPKRPLERDLWELGTAIGYSCPTCGYDFPVGYRHRFCCECAQELNWG